MARVRDSRALVRRRWVCAAKTYRITFPGQRASPRTSSPCTSAVRILVLGPIRDVNGPEISVVRESTDRSMARKEHLPDL